MQKDYKIYLKFPAVLKDKLLKKEIELPEATEFNYNPILVYRAVERKKDEISKP